MANTKKAIDLKDLDKGQLRAFAESIGEKAFRGQQLYEWLFARGVESFDEMTNLSKALRDRLKKEAVVGRLKLCSQAASERDNCTKYLFGLKGGLKIESVLMIEDDRATLCVSTQVGCAIDCKFCATGTMGLQRNLTAGEIVGQLLAAQKLSGAKVSNIVCMGMGEPFHNYDNLVKACHILSDADGPGLAARRIVVSTSGLVPAIYRYADEKHRFRLAISLNATTDAVRAEIMPVTKKWPIWELLKAVRYYVEKSGQIVTFEYVLLDGINDTDADALRLRRLVAGLRCKINLIPYNATLGSFRRSPQERISRFYEQLNGLRAPVTVRWSKGDDIAAGCGQLASSAAEG